LVETPVIQTGSLSASGCFILKGWTTRWQPHPVQDWIPRCLGDAVPLPLAERGDRPAGTRVNAPNLWTFRAPYPTRRMILRWRN